MSKGKIVNIVLVATIVALLGGLAYFVRMLPTADKVAILQTENMACDCRDAIEKALQAKKGVALVKVDVNSRKITVGFDSKKIRPESIASSVSCMGYRSRVAQLLSIEQYRTINDKEPGEDPTSSECGSRR